MAFRNVFYGILKLKFGEQHVFWDVILVDILNYEQGSFAFLFLIWISWVCCCEGCEVVLYVKQELWSSAVNIVLK